MRPGQLHERKHRVEQLYCLRGRLVRYPRPVDPAQAADEEEEEPAPALRLRTRRRATDSAESLEGMNAYFQAARSQPRGAQRPIVPSEGGPPSGRTAVAVSTAPAGQSEAARPAVMPAAQSEAPREQVDLKKVTFEQDVPETTAAFFAETPDDPNFVPLD